MIMRLYSFAALLLAACGPAVPAADESINASNPLERAARERGVVYPEADDLTGVFERRHELGRDAMCVVADGPANWRFGITAAFGPGLSCAATGRILREDNGWRLIFSGAEGCDALVQEEEAELRLPGDLPSQCEKLCPRRASLAGLRLPRASWSVADAKRLQMRGDHGKMLRPCGA